MDWSGNDKAQQIPWSRSLGLCHLCVDGELEIFEAMVRVPRVIALTLLMELLVLLGPSTGPNPWKSTLFVSVVTFHPNFPTSSQRIPFDTMMIRFRDLNTRHTSVSVDIC